MIDFSAFRPLGLFSSGFLDVRRPDEVEPGLHDGGRALDPRQDQYVGGPAGHKADQVVEASLQNTHVSAQQIALFWVKEENKKKEKSSEKVTAEINAARVSIKRENHNIIFKLVYLNSRFFLKVAF